VVRRAHLPVLLANLLQRREALNQHLAGRDALMVWVRAAPRETTESGLCPVDSRAGMAGGLQRSLRIAASIRLATWARSMFAMVSPLLYALATCTRPIATAAPSA